MKKRIKSLMLFIVLMFSLIASPVFPENNFWNACLNAIHTRYEDVFAPYDREWIQYIYNKYARPEPYDEFIQEEHEKLFKKTFMRTTFHKYLPAPPKIMGTVGKEMFDYLQIGIKKKLNDDRWQYTTVSEMERFLRWYEDKTVPIPIFNDCDDSAQRINGIIKFWSNGLAQGLYDLEGHQRIWCFCLPDELVNTDYRRSDCKFYYIEPQSNKLTLLNPKEIIWIMG